MKSIKDLVVGWDCFNPLELKKLWSQKQVVGLCLLLDLGEKKNWATRLKHPIRKDYEGNQLMHRYCRRSPCRILHRSWCAPWQGGWSRWSSPLWPCSPSQECSAHTWASHEYSTNIIWRSDILPSPKSISMLKMRRQMHKDTNTANTKTKCVCQPYLGHLGLLLSLNHSLLTIGLGVFLDHLDKKRISLFFNWMLSMN